jgi:putative ABC transport system substrate-binding protein
MVQAKPDAIFAIGPDAVSAARGATATIPIVVFSADPVAAGYAESRAHPGGHVTGVSISAGELNAKRLDLLHEAVPGARRVAALMLTSVPEPTSGEQAMRDVAHAIGIDFLRYDADGPEGYPAAFVAMRAAGVQALVIQANPIFYRDAAQLAALALGAGLPTVCEWAEMAHSGCLLGYGPSRTELRRRNGVQIAKIFQGAAPADMPIETATRFEFAINSNTAKALGIAVPQAILARADEVIE